MGAGKTWMGKQVGLLTGLPTFDLDVYIEQRAGQSIPALFKQKGEDYFRSMEQNSLHEITADNSHLVLSCGGGTPCFFDNLEFMKKNGTVVWLDPPVSILVNRLQEEMNSRPLLAEIVPSDLEDYVRLKLAERSTHYEQAHYRMQDTMAEPSQLVKLIQHG